MRERIKKIRKKDELTQASFAAIHGVVPSYISRVETGGLKPSRTLLIAICLLGGIDFDWLVTGVGRMNKKYDANAIRDLMRRGKIPRKLKAAHLVIDYLLNRLDSAQANRAHDAGPKWSCGS
jgi:transcriptional regulator with XRE-family HTH domain